MTFSRPFRRVSRVNPTTTSTPDRKAASIQPFPKRRQKSGEGRRTLKNRYQSDKFGHETGIDVGGTTYSKNGQETGFTEKNRICDHGHEVGYIERALSTPSTDRKLGRWTIS
jgi:hypothetical protein